MTTEEGGEGRYKRYGGYKPTWRFTMPEGVEYRFQTDDVLDALEGRELGIFNRDPSQHALRAWMPDHY